MRVAIAVAGLAALAWGAWLAWEFAAASTRDGLQALAWFVGGTLAHDLVLAPLAGAVGLLVGRWLPPVWRAPVAVGGALSGVLVLLAVPLLWRPVGVPANPGLHDADYARGLLLALGVVWLGILIAGGFRSVRRTSRTRAGEG